MSRCRAYRFRVYPSGLALHHAEAFPDVSWIFLTRHRARELYSFVKEPASE